MAGHDLPGLLCVRRINDPGAGGAQADEVYLARRLDDGAEVAVRVYDHRVRSQRDRFRFEQEVAALRALDDVPHVAALRGAGVSPAGRAYIVMDYCASGSLQDHLVTVGCLTPTEVRRIGAKLAAALAGAHRREIFHRNVKPANILINAAGQPELADFGLVALTISDGDYMPPALRRDRSFVAPEAYLPELMSAAADIYALGATLYSLLAGWAPRADEPHTGWAPLAMAVDGDALADLPKVPWALMSIVRRAMAIDPRDRYEGADELAAALAGVA